MRTFAVFVIRHGERLDEALKKQGERPSLELKIDPPLTKIGYEQAREAFVKLKIALAMDGKQRKVATFSSPLRRAIGTSFLLSEAGFGDCEMLQWAWTSPPSDENSKHSFPILVLNGLGSCAARMVQGGGADAMVEAGYVPCGDFSHNNGSSSCPAAQELKYMQEEIESSSGSGDLIQYSKIDRVTGEMVPLAPLVSTSQSYNEHKSNETSCFFPKDCIQSRGETFLEAIDRAVRIADTQNCDTLFVVSHREAVRDLVEQWGLNGQPRPRLPYCCISSFVATLQDDQRVKWKFHGVKDYSRFDPSSIPS